MTVKINYLSKFKVLGDDSPLVQPNYNYALVFYVINLLAGLTCSDLARYCSLGGLGAVVFFSYAMYDIGAICIACLLGVFIQLIIFSDDPSGSRVKFLSPTS